jgi:D-inositol-3-phosphate glycosyltransferase
VGEKEDREVHIARARALPIGPLPRRIATISVHTSPLEQPGSGDAGGMNVYIVELSKRFAALGIEVDIFTRATSSALPPSAELVDGVTVRHITAGPFEGLSKNDLPSQLCPFASGVLRAEAVREPGWYDVVHSHYWLSGQVAWLAKERWGVPMVHSSHTLAKVKNLTLAEGDTPEPNARAIGEAQVVATADRLIASTADEADELVQLYDADPSRIVTIAPGVDLDRFTPTDPAAARARLGIAPDAVLLLFVGRLQPLKAPDVLLRAAADLLGRDPSLRSRLVVAVVGGPSGNGCAGARGPRRSARPARPRLGRPLRAAREPGRAGRLVPRRRCRRRTESQRVVRPGSAGGAGLRHARRRGSRRRAADGRRARALRGCWSRATIRGGTPTRSPAS